jgi:hypothetical protein
MNENKKLLWEIDDEFKDLDQIIEKEGLIKWDSEKIQIIYELGEGASSNVYLIKYIPNQKQFAIKNINYDNLFSWKQEIRILKYFIKENNLLK